MILRPARPEDAAGIGAIWNPIVEGTVITFWPTPRSEAEIAEVIRQRAAEGHPFLVAEDAGAILGFATYSQFRGGAGYARSMEHTIHAAPAARGRGLGRRMLTAIEDHARAVGHRLMIGAITGSNTASVAFHAACGYGEWGRIPAAGWKFGAFHDLVLMGKDLAPGPVAPA
ncbi:GNAT family N-acetyltransferase [Paracoccus tibetensis]|uniref:Phosphinothricin acetyltransferase n=1 Tax=Paracoccus tibetensis TaxID=336292 RepID=A0A1G5H7I5_9RHOB|nr:GNAT family N-acetyltransferase [Paracoccus tibetensis]SCY58908.1 phosphinothricin acetyltransferase [Paracoccus tibetensis]